MSWETLPELKITQAQMRFADQAVSIGDQSAQDADSLAFMTRMMVLATLPHSDPGDVPGFGRRNGDFSLTIQPGVNEVNGQYKSIGIPYGGIPRLLMAWITTEAVRTKERKIPVFDTQKPQEIRPS